MANRKSKINNGRDLDILLNMYQNKNRNKSLNKNQYHNLNQLLKKSPNNNNNKFMKNISQYPLKKKKNTNIKKSIKQNNKLNKKCKNPKRRNSLMMIKDQIRINNIRKEEIIGEIIGETTETMIK